MARFIDTGHITETTNSKIKKIETIICKNKPFKVSFARIEGKQSVLIGKILTYEYLSDLSHL